MKSLKTAIDAFGTQQKLAAALGVKQQYISYWLRNRVPAEWCRKIEDVTDGAVTRADLRPDLFD